MYNATKSYLVFLSLLRDIDENEYQMVYDETKEPFVFNLLEIDMNLKGKKQK